MYILTDKKYNELLNISCKLNAEKLTNESIYKAQGMVDVLDKLERVT